MDPIIGGAIIGAGSNALGLIGQKQREKRALDNQKKLNEHGQEMGMKTWNETSYPAQMKKMKEAGVNPALMYGMGGGAGGSTGTPSGGSAPAPQEMGIAKSIESGIQVALMKAQKENIEADTENKKAGASATAESGRGTYLDNIIKEYGISGSPEEQEVQKSKRGYGTAGVAPNSATAKRMQAEANTTVEQLNNAKKQNDIADAETIIKRFEADMAKEGISSNSPYYIKLMTDILRKAGVLDWVKQ